MILGRAWGAEGVRSWHFLSRRGIQARDPGRMFCQFSATFSLVEMSAPSRIRTYAHGSGGQVTVPKCYQKQRPVQAG